MSISPSEIRYIQQSCAANFRLDGRSNVDFRPYNLLSPESSPVLSNGSSRLFLPASNTDILCSIKAELVHPSYVKSEGVIDVNVDILPFASTSTSRDRKEIRREELEVASTLSHLLLPHLINRNKLVVLEGRYVWRLNIDVLVTHCDGNLMDICGMSIWGAMQNLRLPSVVPIEKVNEDHAQKSGGKASDEIMLDGDIANSVTPEGVIDCPIVVTVYLIPVPAPDALQENETIRKVKKKHETCMIVDSCRDEEKCAATKVSISIDGAGNICGVHKYGRSSTLGVSYGNIKFDMLSKIQSFALSCSKTLFAVLKKSRENNGGVKDLENAEEAYSNFFRGQFELQ